MVNGLINEYILPTRIVAQSDNLINAKALFSNREKQVFLTQNNLICCKGKGYIILDYGREYCGGIRILTHRFIGQNSFGNIRIRFGESVSETCAEIGEKNAGNHHSVRDFTVALPTLCDQTFGDTGFRFVRIDFLEDIEYNLINIYASIWRKDIEFIGDFNCSDNLINEIFETAKYTLYLTMQKYLWEGVKRDRLVWVGDMQQQVLAITYLFGKNELVEKSLKESVLKNPLPCWFGNIPSYSLLFIQIVYEYYLKVKNTEFVLEMLPYMEGVLEQLDKCVDNQGHIDYSLISVDARNDYFIDWPTNGTVDAKYGNNYLYIIILNHFKKLYLSLGLKINPLCDKVIEKLNKIEYQYIKAKQIVSLGFFANKIDKEETAKKLTNGGAKGLSTFMSYHILKALSQSASIIDAIDILKEYYGGMISRGATTFWEDFDVEWLKDSGRIDELPLEGQKDLHGDFGEFCYKGFRHSLCHGWSCGPISFLFEDVLGVKVLDAGCETIMIKPNLGNLTYCKGTFPTPKGNVYIEHKLIDGRVETKIDAPSEIKIIKGVDYDNN